jgi:hypothetical protein
MIANKVMYHPGMRPLLPLLAAFYVSWSGSALADPTADQSARPEDGEQPPPVNAHYVQYGVALAAHSTASPGDVCPSQGEVPCILGSGGGLGIRVGYQSRDSWYAGGAYEFSSQDSSNLLRLAILQQLRAEARYLFARERRLAPYLWFGTGLAVYGNEWSAETIGMANAMGVAGRFQLSRTSQVGAGLSYRPLLFHSWRDSAGQERANGFFGFGFAHLISLEVTFEISSPLPRW